MYNCTLLVLFITCMHVEHAYTYIHAPKHTHRHINTNTHSTINSSSPHFLVPNTALREFGPVDTKALENVIFEKQRSAKIRYIVYVCMYVCVYVHVWTYVCMHACMSVRVFVCLCLVLRERMSIVYTCISINIQTCMPQQGSGSGAQLSFGASR